MNKQIFTLVRKMLSMLYLTGRDKKMFKKKNTISERGLNRRDLQYSKRVPYTKSMGKAHHP